MAKKKGNPNLGDVGVRITPETAREMQRRGAIVRAKNKTLRDSLKAKLEESDEEGQTRMDKATDELSKQMADGKLSAIELGAKILGELPNKHEISGPGGSDLFAKKSDKELDEEIERLSKG